MRTKHKEKAHVPPYYSLTKAILDILYDMGEPFPIIGGSFYKKLDRWSRGAPRPAQWRLNRALKYLETRERIKTVEKDGKLFLKLTRKGKLRALMDKIERDFDRPLVWDGKWRLIIWDIPEKASVSRNRLRRFVKDLSFLQLQKSVFITPYPIPTPAVEYLKESKLMRFIRFLRVDKIEDDRYFKKKYHLK